MGESYKSVGIDVSKLDEVKGSIGLSIKKTYSFNENIVKLGFGHYSGVVHVKSADIAFHTDGVGTKTLIASAMNKYDTVGIDCIAMNVNDIVCVGAKPISFLDYIAANRNDKRIIGQIIKGLVKGAKMAGISIVGGETAIMPDMFNHQSFTFDLNGTVLGYLHKDPLVGNKISEGDVIIGIGSSGLHSNGYSLARKVLLKHHHLNDRIRGMSRLGDEMLKPTIIYSRPVLDVIKSFDVHGVAHITGGAFTKLMRLKNIGYMIDEPPEPAPIFHLLNEYVKSDREMYRTFNMGVGTCVIAPRSQAEQIINKFGKYSMKGSIIGRIINRKGVFLRSIRLT